MASRLNFISLIAVKFIDTKSIFYYNVIATKLSSPYFRQRG